MWQECQPSHVSCQRYNHRPENPKTLSGWAKLHSLSASIEPPSVGRPPHHEAALVALAAELLAVIDGGGCLQAPNPAWAATLGRPVEGERWLDLVHPEDRPRAAGMPDGLICRLEQADGGERTVRWRFARTTDGVHVAGTDVTDIVRAHAELQDFAYTASHDLAEPLRMITSYLELLKRRYAGQLDETADEFIGYAVGGADRMKDLIEALLAFSRVGTHELEPAPLDLGAVARQVVAAHERAVAEAGAQVTLAEPMEPVTGDATLIGRLLSHLLDNALTFRALDRTAEISVSAVRDGDGVRIDVTDNGIGIAAAHLERVFKPFARLHGRDEYEGTGIGLSVCRRIAERHDGRIGVESEDGAGSRFWVWVPR